jgi:hypothetical protein
MKTFARIDKAAIAELLTTACDPASLFSPLLHWQDVTGDNVAVGWVVTQDGFAPPPQPTAPSVAVPTLAELQAELTVLTSRIAQLSQH